MLSTTKYLPMITSLPPINLKLFCADMEFGSQIKCIITEKCPLIVHLQFYFLVRLTILHSWFAIKGVGKRPTGLFTFVGSVFNMPESNFNQDELVPPSFLTEFYILDVLKTIENDHELHVGRSVFG